MFDHGKVPFKCTCRWDHRTCQGGMPIWENSLVANIMIYIQINRIYIRISNLATENNKQFLNMKNNKKYFLVHELEP